MRVEFQSDQFFFNYDARMGVGNFERRCDGALTSLETGSDCAKLRSNLQRLQQKTASPKYPVSAPSFEEIFNSIADEYTFD